MPKIQDFHKFLLGYLLSSFGNYMTPVALTFAMVGQPNGLLKLAIVLAARTIPSAFFSLFGGWSADSISRFVEASVLRARRIARRVPA